MMEVQRWCKVGSSTEEGVQRCRAGAGIRGAEVQTCRGAEVLVQMRCRGAEVQSAVCRRGAEFWQVCSNSEGCRGYAGAQEVQ